MITLKLEEVLTKKGKTAYEVAKNTRLHQSVISKIRRNEAKMIGLDVLNMLCEELDCEPSDLISFTSSKPTAKTPVIVPETVKGESVKGTTAKPVRVAKALGDGFLTVEQVAGRLEPIAGRVLSPRNIVDYIGKGNLKSTQTGKGQPHSISESDYAEFEIYYRNLKGKAE
jgi:putative transcriptional regulator